MLCPSRAAHSILTTICTYSNEFTNRSSNKGVFTSFQHVKLGFVPLSKFSSRCRLKPDSRYVRLKLVEITCMGRSEFKFTQAVGTNPQAQKMSLDRSYSFVETSTRRLQQILNFFGRYKKTQVARIRHSSVGSGSKLTRGSCRHVGTRN